MLRHFDCVNITNTNTVSAVFINLPLTVFVFTITTTVTAVSTNRIPLNLKGKPWAYYNSVPTHISRSTSQAAP